jgi:hypothetical protein
LLAELANASLLDEVANELTASDEKPQRYRYHDRVRDYAQGKLTLSAQEARRRLQACYCDWDMVRLEFEAVGAFTLAGQYLRLRDGQTEVPAELAPWYHFVRGQASVLGEHPKLFFQQAFNEPSESPVSRAAQQRVDTAEEPWLEWLNRPREFVPPACLQVLSGHTDAVRSVAVTADGRTAVSASGDNTVRVWDLLSGQCCAVHQADSPEAHQAWASVRAAAALPLEPGPHDVAVVSAPGEVIARFPGQFTKAAFSADQRHGIAGDGIGQVYLLRLRRRDG